MDKPTEPTRDQPGDDKTHDERALPPTPAGEEDAPDDAVDVASEDSFPASDPPSFTGSTTD